MGWLLRFFTSSIGAKMLMAITGLALVLFILGHMLGNLQIFAGREAINSYAAALQSMPALLWTVRGGLVVIVLLHALSAITLTLANRAARPIKYAYNDYVVTGYAARTMIWGGIIVGLFIAYHVAHFTLLLTNPEFAAMTDSAGRHDVYGMVVVGFEQIPISIIYIVAIAALCLHLSHGIPSFAQSLGLHHPKFTPLLEKLGLVIALAIFIGMASIPASVLAGWLTVEGA